VNELARWLFVPAVLFGPLGIVIVVFRVIDIVERRQAPQPDPAEVEQRQVDVKFAQIVATRLADLETKE
jgi:hypothetical protein